MLAAAAVAAFVAAMAHAQTCPDEQTTNFVKNCAEGTGDAVFLVDSSLQSKATFPTQLVGLRVCCSSRCPPSPDLRCHAHALMRGIHALHGT